jgi:hypothetical protein
MNFLFKDVELKYYKYCNDWYLSSSTELFEEDMFKNIFNGFNNLKIKVKSNKRCIYGRFNKKGDKYFLVNNKEVIPARCIMMKLFIGRDTDLKEKFIGDVTIDIIAL